jgi:hypothetical protein
MSSLVNHPRRGSCAYVLRLVTDPTFPERLAGRLEHVPSGRRHDFDDADALLACLRHEQRCAHSSSDADPGSVR